MPRYSVSFMSRRGMVWVKSYRNLTKAKRAATGIAAKTSNFPLKIMANSVKKTWPTKATYPKSRGWNYGKYLRRYNKTYSTNSGNSKKSSLDKMSEYEFAAYVNKQNMKYRKR